MYTDPPRGALIFISALGIFVIAVLPVIGWLAYAG